MPSWSGLHMSWTTSSGHSSRSSNSRSTSSGKRFLAKSRSDFRLNFKVLAAIIINSSLCCDAAQFTGFVGQLRQELQDVVDNSDVGDLKNRSLRILIDSDQERVAFNASQVLESAADATCQVNFWFNSGSGGAN